MTLKTNPVDRKFDSPYFTIREVAKGIYATETEQNMYAGANGGFIDLGNRTVLVDSGMIQGATQDLIRACQVFTGKAPGLVVCTHFHTDHVLGNSFIPESIPIIGSKHTIKQMRTHTNEILMNWRKVSVKERKEDIKQLQTETDPNERQKLISDLAFLDMITEDDYQIRVPDWILEGTLTIHGNDYDIIVCNVGEAHTMEDIIVRVPSQGVLFAGDITFANLRDINLDTAVMPFSVDPQKSIKLLQQLKEEAYQIIISGHGKNGKAELLQANIEFIQNKIIRNT